MKRGFLKNALDRSRLLDEVMKKGTKPPNFLFILTDQQRWDAVGSYGNRYMHTPNLDRLAGEGAMFTNCYVTQAVCSPSRASILSGLYPHSHRVVDNIYSVDDVISSPEYNMGLNWPYLLQQNGYRTCWIGKWHLGEKAPKCFDEWHGFNSLLPHWMGEPHKSGYRCDVETRIGLDFLKANRSRPFVLCQSYYPPHTPYTAPKEYWKYYENTPLEPVEYYAACSNIDWNIGRLLARLEDLDLLDNTFMIFTSDHGDHFGKRPGGAQKRAAYDDCAKVPLIIRYPEYVKAGSMRGELVSNADIMPTILEAAGLKIPEGIHGNSLIPLLKGKQVLWRDFLVIENRENASTSEGAVADLYSNSRAVRTRDWKLIARDRLSVRAEYLYELYDMVSDPHEQKNLFDERHSERAESMLQKLRKWAKRTDDRVASNLKPAI